MVKWFPLNEQGSRSLFLQKEPPEMICRMITCASDVESNQQHNRGRGKVRRTTCLNRLYQIVQMKDFRRTELNDTF